MNVANVDADDRTLTAWHEAGHQVAHVALGGEPGLVSIKRKRRWCGVSFHDEGAEIDPDELEAADLTLPAVTWSCGGQLHAEIIVILAGAQGERFAPRDALGNRGDYLAVESVENRLADATLALSKADEQLLALGDYDPEPEAHDMVKAFERARLLVGDEQRRQIALLTHLELEAYALLQFRTPALERLAAALLRHTTLPAEATREVLATMIGG